jgi:uncharacterized membrane protein (DUF485 family)
VTPSGKEHPVTTQSHDQAHRHDPVYDELAARPEFARLRHLYRRFIIPATAVFMAWYALYVLMSMFATDFMNTRLFGHVNVALVFGLLQFVSTFVIAWLYSRYSTKHLDPLARELTDEFDRRREGN